MRFHPLVFALLLAAGTPAAASELWLHISVDEEGPRNETVRINLPFRLIERALPLIPVNASHRCRVSINDNDWDREVLREVVREIGRTPEGVLVTADDGDVRAIRRGEILLVEIQEWDSDLVRLRMPWELARALAGDDEIDFAAVARVLSRQGEGDVLTVQDEDATVRIWVDRQPEARRVRR